MQLSSLRFNLPHIQHQFMSATLSGRPLFNSFCETTHGTFKSAWILWIANPYHKALHHISHLTRSQKCGQKTFPLCTSPEWDVRKYSSLMHLSHPLHVHTFEWLPHFIAFQTYMNCCSDPPSQRLHDSWNKDIEWRGTKFVCDELSMFQKYPLELCSPICSHKKIKQKLISFCTHHHSVLHPNQTLLLCTYCKTLS